jgi:hypothetical protein
MRITRLWVVSFFLLAACADSYRYPCQDPAKAGDPECSCSPRVKNKALSSVTLSTNGGVVGVDC